MKKLYLFWVASLAIAGNISAQEHFVVQHTPNEAPLFEKTYVRQDPASYKKQTKPTRNPVEFAVQLSASSRPVEDKSALNKWSDIAPVFVHAENGMYKVRLGPFNSQEEAKTALLKAKSRGKADAFIVVQKGIENHEPFTPGKNREAGSVVASEPSIPATVEASTTPATTKTAVVEPENVGEFKVRLASYLKPGSFSTKEVDQYGTLESYRQGEWTILMLGGFKSRKDAERVREIVREKGFPDARVVVDIDGILQ